MADQRIGALRALLSAILSLLAAPFRAGLAEIAMVTIEFDAYLYPLLHQLYA